MTVANQMMKIKNPDGEDVMDPSNLVNPEAFDRQVWRFLEQNPV